MVNEDEVPEAVLLDNTANEEPAAYHKPVPVTLITGFLGAGKTTLVRHILTAPHGLRIAVILNEFGEGVEDAYYQDIQGLRSASGEWVELDNGCMCCSVKSEFVQALESLLAKERKPDYILIETTGMANPGPVAVALWTDDDLEAGVQLDSIITVVDAINIDRQLHDKRADGTVNEAQVQVAYADLILLNKMDLCQEEAIARAEADIRAINSSVTILRTSRCTVDLAMLLNRQGYKHGADISLTPIAEDGDGDDGSESTLKPIPENDGPDTKHGQKNEGCCGLTRTSVGRHLGSGTLASSHGHSRAVSLSLERLSSGDEGSSPAGKKMHDPEIQTVSLSSSKPLAMERVKAFIDKLLWDREVHPEDIYRVKGVLHIQGEDKKHMLQAVYELYNISPSAPWRAQEARVSRVVVIGRQLNKQVLSSWFKEAECIDDA